MPRELYAVPDQFTVALPEPSGARSDLTLTANHRALIASVRSKVGEIIGSAEGRHTMAHRAEVGVGSCIMIMYNYKT